MAHRPYHWRLRPVAFYTDGKSVPGNADLEFVTGNADLEFTYGGAVWRFSKVGNREAFAARPDVYMPRALAVMIRSALPMASRLRAIGACG